MPLIQVFIATYNRPSLVLKAIHSALNQNFDSFEVIVSDNSTNNETEILVSEIEDKRLSYKRRKPSLASIEHFNAILKDVTTDYFVIFHDDDQMLPYMLSSLMKYIEDNSDDAIIAIGSNALVMKNNIVNKYPFRRKLNKNIIINNPSELSKLYLIKNGIVPFSSYMYCRRVAELISFDIKKGGKYCDVSFLLDVSSKGKIINLAQPLMILNQHLGQDSNDNIFEDKSKLINYITKITELKRKDNSIINFRLYNLYTEICKSTKSNCSFFWSKRNLKIILFLLKNYKYEYLAKLLIRSMQYHIAYIFNR